MVAGGIGARRCCEIISSGSRTYWQRRSCHERACLEGALYTDRHQRAVHNQRRDCVDFQAGGKSLSLGFGQIHDRKIQIKIGGDFTPDSLGLIARYARFGYD